MKWLLPVLLSCILASPLSFLLTLASPSGRAQPLTYLSPNPYTTTAYPLLAPTPQHTAAPSTKSSVSGSYLLVAPSMAVPGFNFSLMFESFVDKTLHMDATILLKTYNYVIGQYQYNVVVRASEQFVKGQPGFLHLPVPENLAPGVYMWGVSCDACLFFGTIINDDQPFPILNYVQSTLNVNFDTVNIFVQTDKAIYKPGQLVHYRVFAVYPNLEMYTGVFQIQIKDPNGNKIQHLIDVSGTEGVAEGSLQLADKPLYGDWTILVEVQTTSRSKSYSKGFTVQDYKLPRFEVTVELPSYVLTTDLTLQGKVKATYTFGQPVKGMVELHVSPPYGIGSCGNEPPFVQMAFDINGEATFSVPRTDINRIASIYDGATVKVTAFVKEALTDVRLHGSEVITFHSSPYKVTILDNTPSVFKPGLPFSIFVKCSMQDDSPVPGDNSIAVFTTARYFMYASNSFLFGTSSFSGTYPLPVQTVSVPPSGVVKVNMDIPVNASSITVTVDFKDLRASKTIEKMFSVSKNYMQLTLLDKNLRSGQRAHVEVKATEPMSELWYQILSRGSVYDSRLVDAKGQQVVTLEIPLTPKATPTAHMLAYYVRPDLEIVADSIAFNVEGVFANEVTLEFSRNKTEPHEAIELHVTADPGSTVHVLAVDQSVLLLKKGNDVTPDQAADVVANYDVGKAPTDSAFALSLSQQSILYTLQGTGVKVFSDAHLSATTEAPEETPRDPSIYGPDILELKPPIMWPSGELPMMTPAPGNTYAPVMWPPSYTGEPQYPSAWQGMTPTPGFEFDSSLSEVQRVRNLFPETFLWLSRRVNENGSVAIQATVPDTITSWVTTAFATNLQSGLGMTPSSSKLTVFQSFFVSLSLPTSVVRGEHIVIAASVFNYLPSDLPVLVTLPGSHEYSSILIGSDGSEALSSEDQQHTVIVKSNEQAEVYFPIIPLSVGAISIEVSARSTLAADAVRRQLVVEAEGVPNEFSIPIFISLDPTTGPEMSRQSFSVSVPPDVVQGSSRSRIKVTGDILGPSVDGLESLLRMPVGCGEQNMVTMAPDLYVARYLRLTGQMTATLETRIKHLLQTGYQSELTYQRKDGAFSAFGDSDNAGSTWLTAFVLRVFHEASSDVYVDSAVLQKAMNWLLLHQNADGSFNEFGHIFDAQMAAFSDHSPGLTSFVLLALMENSDVPVTKDEKSMHGNAIAKAQGFLERTHASISDDLSLALATLALLKAKSSSADAAFAILRTRSVSENGMKFWKSNHTNQAEAYTRWQPAVVRARPIDIQVTSYALLAYVAKGLIREGMTIVHWLTRQRNPFGGFSSTQDTIVALQAMTEFLAKTAPSSFELRVDVTAEQSISHFNISRSNALVLQSTELSFIPSEVTVQASGTGTAVAELDFFFNAESDFGKPAFGVSTVLLDDYLNSFKLMICTSWLLDGSSGMVIQQVGIPSGFAPDMSSVGNVAGLKRVEQTGRYVDVYFDTVTRNALCYTIMFDRQDRVAQSQAAYVITQDYYEPGNRATVRYQPVSLRDSTVCDVCSQCCA